MDKIRNSTLGVIFFSFILAVYFYPQLPDTIASHWDAFGNVNGYSGKLFGIFLLPIMSLALFILFIFIPKIDPLGKNIQSFRRKYDWFVLLLISFLAYVQIFVILWNMNIIDGGVINISIMQYLSPAFAILFFYMGILLKSAKQNWFVGIRTPWTLSSKKVWDKTHHLGSKLFRISGIIALLGTFSRYAFFFTIAPVVLSSIYLTIYSYLLFRKEKKN